MSKYHTVGNLMSRPKCNYQVLTRTYFAYNVSGNSPFVFNAIARPTDVHYNHYLTPSIKFRSNIIMKIMTVIRNDSTKCIYYT